MPLTVNGTPVPESLIEEEASRMRDHLYRAMKGEPQAAIEKRLREWSTENAIEKTLLRQAALADPEPIPSALVEQAGGTDESRHDIELRLRIERLIDRYAGRIGAPKLKEVNEYYRKHRAQLIIPERVHAAHILKRVTDGATEADALAAIKAAEAEISQGAAFEEVADRVSDDGGSGGNLGWVSPGQLPPEFDTVAFSLAPDSVSRVFRTVHGFHIVKVYQHQTERPSSFDEARATIENTLIDQKRQKALERVVDFLRTRAIITKE
jgi:parvulin-like peptidyl-prolyl isomerase